jgi:hypothetical protein
MSMRGRSRSARGLFLRARRHTRFPLPLRERVASGASGWGLAVRLQVGDAVQIKVNPAKPEDSLFMGPG